MVSTAQDIMSRYGIDQDFASSIETLGNDLGVDPMYLANTMYAESRLDPSIRNIAGSGATGLIQFMPQTAANLGTTTDELSRMTPVEQMEYVRRYFSADNLGAGRLRDLQNDPSQHNVNMAVFLPSMIGKPVDTQIPQKYWRQNGSIRTPADYTRSAEERVNDYIQSSPVDTQPDPVDAQTDKMLSEEQPGSTFRSEVVPASFDTDAVTSGTEEETLEVDDTLMAEHEEKIRRGEAPRGSKPTEEGGYYTEGEYGFRTNPAGEVVADLEVNSLENVATSVGERLRTILGNNEDSETLELKGGGSVEKEVEFVKEDDDDDDVPDPPPGATPEEVADDIPAYLSTGEYVLPANVVRYIGLKNITGMHQRALSELQQMEDLDIIENVDENGYVEEDDDEMDYMKPEGVVEIVVAEHHPKGLMAMGFAEGGMINSDSSMEEGQVLPTSDIFSEGVYAQVNIDRSVDSENAVESDKVITAPVAFSSAPGKTAYLAYITPEEAASLRQAKQGFSSDGNGQEVSDGQYQHLGPKGLMSFNGDRGGDGSSAATGRGSGDDAGAAAAAGASAGKGGATPSEVAQSESPLGGVVGAINEALGFDKDHGYGGKGVTDSTTGEVYGPGGLASVSRSYTEKDVKDPKSVATAVGMGLGSIAGSLAGIGQAAVNAAVAAGVDVQGPSTNDIGGGSQEPYKDEEVDTDSTKTTDTDPLSDYIYVPGVGYRRKIRSVKPLSELKEGGYVSKKGIMARGYSEGGMINSDSSFEEGQVLPTSDIFSEGVYAQANINRSVDSEDVVESDKVITAPIAFSSAPGKTAYLAYITPEEAASLRQAKQGFSSEGNGLEVSDGQYQHLGPKGLMSFNGDGGTGGGDPGPGDGHGGGMSEPVEDLEPEEVEEEKPTDPYEGYAYVKGIGYVPTSRRATSIESASLALSSIFTPGFLGTIGLMGDPNEEL
jgi:hypothetical protein